MPFTDHAIYKKESTLTSSTIQPNPPCLSSYKPKPPMMRLDMRYVFF